MNIVNKTKREFVNDAGELDCKKIYSEIALGSRNYTDDHLRSLDKLQKSANFSEHELKQIVDYSAERLYNAIADMPGMNEDFKIVVKEEWYETFNLKDGE